MEEILEASLPQAMDRSPQFLRGRPAPETSAVSTRTTQTELERR